MIFLGEEDAKAEDADIEGKIWAFKIITKLIRKYKTFIFFFFLFFTFPNIEDAEEVEEVEEVEGIHIVSYIVQIRNALQTKHYNLTSVCALFYTYNSNQFHCFKYFR